MLLKPSERTPLTALAFAAVMMEAGLPPSLLQVVVAPPEQVVEEALRGDAVRMVTFTGSVAIGRRIAQSAAGRKIGLELGGNDPLLVLADADLDVAAKIVVEGAFATAGQSCRGVKRVLADHRIAGALAQAIVGRTRTKTWGDPWEISTEVGSLISEAAADLVQRRCADAVTQGARLLHGGARENAALQPLVLDHVPPTCELVQEETFGPVAPIIRCDGEEEMLRIANGTSHGLQAGVVTDSFAAFGRLARGLKVGGVALLEGPQFDSPLIPFGGVKASGIGREGIPYSVREMCVSKTVLLPF